MIALTLDSNGKNICVNQQHIAWCAKVSNIENMGILPKEVSVSKDATIVMMADKTVFIVKDNLTISKLLNE
jgi:hypothetical protein